MRLSIFIFLLSLLFVSGVFAQTNIALVPLESRGVAETDALILTERLSAELVNTGKFHVYERDMLDHILREQGLQQTGYMSPDYVAQIGKLIGVEQIVGGSVSRISNIYTISVKLVSVETGEIIKTATLDYNGFLSDLLQTGMRDIALQLADLKADSPFIMPALPTPPSPQPNIIPFQLAFIDPIQLYPNSKSVGGLKINLLYGNNKNLYGIDAGFVNFITDNMYGIQSGFINKSRRVVGLQAGFINIAESLAGVQIGLLNFNKSGPFDFLPFINAGFTF